ncbi:MAG: hypothetical protein ACXWXR_05295, partial [Candidatus Limnocylindrales bacterium]
MLTLEAQAGPRLKLGYLNEAGWVGYVRDGIVLVRRFVPLIGQPHPDLGCNTEVYIGGRYLELELLGPLTVLQPGSTVRLVETGELLTTEPIADDAAARA